MTWKLPKIKANSYSHLLIAITNKFSLQVIEYKVQNASEVFSLLLHFTFFSSSMCFFSSRHWMCYPTIPIVLINVILRLYSTWPLLIWLSGSNSPTFKTVVHGIIGGVPVPFPTANGNVNPPVPIQQNQKITYTNAIFVEPAYPKVMQSQRLVAPNFTILGFVYMFSWRTNKTSTGVGNFSNYIN